ncbi:MAG: NfeD family protein [Planctomycetota bacterium]
MSARIPICTLLVLFSASMHGWGAEAKGEKPPQEGYRKGVIIEMQGAILPRLGQYMDRKLERARETGADLVILEIDSPGGVIETTFNIVQKLRDLSWAHTVAFIPEEALSGAAIVALACDEIFMAPTARLGDAGPIFAGPDALFRHAPEKIRSDLARRVRDLASAQGRPPALAEAMVDMNLIVYRVTHEQTGRVTFMSQAEIDSAENPDAWERGPPVLESREGSFLEVNGERAVDLQLAAATVEGRSGLEQRFSIANPPLVPLRRNTLDVAVDVLNHPMVTGLLLVVGAIALYLELSAPGIGVGGLLSGLCFTLFFWSRFLGGTSGWLEIILVVAGIVFLAVELFVLPGFGVAGTVGLLLMAAGVIMASQNHLIPRTARGIHQLGTSLLVLLGSGIVSLIGFAVLSRIHGSIPILNRLVLRAPSAADSNQPGAPSTQRLGTVSEHQCPAAVGDIGISDSPLRPAGRALFGDAYLDVVTDGSFVDRGRRVRVIQISGNRIVVRETDPK